MSPLLTAWQSALAAEQQASFGYGVLGPHLRGADLSLAVACSDAHDTLRDRTAEAVAAAGAMPVEPQADYPTLYPVAGPRAARALATRLEQQCAAAWRYLFSTAANTSGAQAEAVRRSAQSALTASAVRATRWRKASGSPRPTVAFPGL